MNKQIVIILVFIVVGLLWYFFAPIKWTFGLRGPRNYKECLQEGGVQGFGGSWQTPNCIYEEKEFFMDYPEGTLIN